jgi:hypothetical protein
VKRHIFSAILVVTLCAFSWAQEDSHTVPIPAIIGPEMPYTEILTPPMPVSGMQMPLTFSSESPRSNFVMGSLQFGVGYDDNLFSTPSNHISDESYLILPSFDIGQTRERWNWDFGYSPGFTINQRVTEQNQAAQNLSMVFAYRLSPHVTVQINEHFEKANSLFSGLLGNTTVAGPGPLQQPNSSVLTPVADRTGNTTGLDLTYQFSASSLVGASGNYYFVNYDSPANSAAGTSSLIDSRSWGGNAFYARRFSNRHWAGVTYNYQRLLFDPGYRTGVNRTLLFYSISTGPQLTFSLWAGPEQTTSLMPSVPQDATSATTSEAHWGVAGGADLTWQGRRTTFRLEYTRQTSDGGGLAQAVHLQQVGGELQERLTARWTTGLSLGYGKNQPLNVVKGQAPYNSWLGNVALNCHLTENLAFGLRYGRDQLTYEYPAATTAQSNRNRAWFSMSYSFSRPLGR